MASSIKNKTIKGVIWTSLDRILNQIAGFIISIVLARLLCPADYGILGIMNVFIGIAGLFVDCGLSSGVLRKHKKTDEDYSTVFWCNIIMSFLCYFIIYISSPFIARYYKIHSLTLMLRILSLLLIINSLYTIQITRLTALVDFKSQAIVSFPCCLISGSIGLTLAYLKCGAWSIVAQQLFASIYKTIAYWWISGWHPKLVFSKQSFKSFFSFGSRILAANILGTIYNYISPLIIGKKYSMTTLGMYTRADSLLQLPGSIFQSTFGRVIYPILVSIQDEEKRLKETYKKYLRIITSLVVPGMLIFAAVSEPLILTLIGDKWRDCVPYIIILSIVWMVDPIIAVNLNILYVKGRSDIVLKLEVIKKIIALTIVIISVQFGVIWLCIGRSIYSCIALIINLYACSPFIGMSISQQIKEVYKMYIGGGSAAIIAFIINYAILHYYNINNTWSLNLIALMLSMSIGFCIYLAWAYYYHFEIIEESIKYLQIFKNKLKNI